MKLFFTSNGCMGGVHFKYGRDPRDFTDAVAETLIASGAARPINVPPPPTPAPSARDMRVALARDHAQEEARLAIEGEDVSLGISGTDDSADTTPPKANAQTSLDSTNSKPLIADRTRGPRARAK